MNPQILSALVGVTGAVFVAAITGAIQLYSWNRVEDKLAKENTRFTYYFQRQLEITIELYGKITDVTMQVERLCSIKGNSTIETQKIYEQACFAAEMVLIDLRDFYPKQAIFYRDEEIQRTLYFLCDDLGYLLNVIKSALKDNKELPYERESIADTLLSTRKAKHFLEAEFDKLMTTGDTKK